MAMFRTAKAKVVHPTFSAKGWGKVRTAATSKAALSGNLIDQASDIFGSPFDPAKYLLTHATIVASVDTEKPAKVKLGSVEEDGFRVNRKYANFRITADTEKYINNNCFLPGTSITMADGTLKPIESICVGDEVLTHKGRTRRVVETFKHEVDTDILEVKIRASNERIYVTEEHPFFVFSPVASCVECGGSISRKVLAISHLLGKHYCSKECYYKRRIPNADLLAQKEGHFTPASSLTTRDFAAMPVVEAETNLDISLKQARLLGLFLAEGYYELDSRQDNLRVGVCWAFHEKERGTLAQDVLDMMRSEFGVECVIRGHTGDHGIHVTTRVCPEAVSFFSSYIKGLGSKTKTLSPALMTAPRTLQMEILRGWFDGDGSAFDTGKDFRMVGVTASQSLASQIKILLHRQKIAPQVQHIEAEGRRRLRDQDDSFSVVSDPSKVCHYWQISCGGCYLEDLVQTTRHEAAYDAAMSSSGGYQQAPTMRFLNGYCLQMITNITPVAYCGPVYNFETEDDHSYIAGGVAVHNCDAWDRNVLLKSYRTFIGGHNFVEHVQVADLSKGRIIDAVARDVGDSIYVDILIATDRKHTELVEAIESGKMSTMSMGCTIDHSTCTKCGNVAVDETEMCQHIRYQKGNTYFDENGVKRKVAELCGHPSVNPTGGVTFIEASWVETPAFEGAVMRNVLDAKLVPSKVMRQAELVLASIPRKWDSTSRQKRARQILAEEDFGFGEDDAGAKDDADAKPKAPADADPFKNLEDEVTQHVLKNVQDGITQKLQKGKNQEVPNDTASSSTDDTLIKQASAKTAYVNGLSALVKTARSDIDLIDRVASYNQSLGVSIPTEIYRAAVRVGSTARYGSVRRFLTACRGCLGRELSEAEANTMIRLGKLLEVHSR